MWSGDSTTTPAELADAIGSAGLDAVCITDHNTIAGATELARSGDLGCHVVVGEEIRTVEGDLIGLFVVERIPPGLRPAQVASLIREQGGLVYVPHPCDGARHSLQSDAITALAGAGLLDIVEVLNAKCPSAYGGPTHGAAPVAASDAHVPAAVGSAWTEIPHCNLDDATAFLHALHRGSVRGSHFDPARKWTARVIPAGIRVEGTPTHARAWVGPHAPQRLGWGAQPPEA